MALSNWLRNNELPDDLHIPTKKEVVSEQIASADKLLLGDTGRIAAAVSAGISRRKQR
jgi:hypothetical protein